MLLSDERRDDVQGRRDGDARKQLMRCQPVTSHISKRWQRSWQFYSLHKNENMYSSLNIRFFLHLSFSHPKSPIIYHSRINFSPLCNFGCTETPRNTLQWLKYYFPKEQFQLFWQLSFHRPMDFLYVLKLTSSWQWESPENFPYDMSSAPDCPPRNGGQKKVSGSITASDSSRIGGRVGRFKIGSGKATRRPSSPNHLARELTPDCSIKILKFSKLIVTENKSVLQVSLVFSGLGIWNYSQARQNGETAKNVGKHMFTLTLK